MVSYNSAYNKWMQNHPVSSIQQNQKYYNVLALVKGHERYIFLYDNESRAETIRLLGRFASNPELSFTWYDAAVLSKKIREKLKKGKLEEILHNRFDRE
jgi:hypothetical protein